MPVPTSSLVMGVMTCVPFGLAIHDTVTRPAKAELEAAAAAAYAEETAEREARIARLEDQRREREAAERKAREEKAAEIAAVVHSQLGDEPASFASSAPLRLGAADRDAILAHAARLTGAMGIAIELRPLAGRVDSIRLTPEAGSDTTPRVCEHLGAKLRAAWPDNLPRNRGGDVLLWLNPRRGHRAVFSRAGGECELKVERYVPAETWIDRGPKSIVPLWAIGQPASRLSYALGEPVEDGGHEWFDLPMGAAVDDTQLVADVVDGKIVHIQAVLAGGDEVALPVLERLTALYGAPAGDDVRVWRSRPQITLDTRHSRVVLTAGKLP